MPIEEEERDKSGCNSRVCWVVVVCVCVHVCVCTPVCLCACVCVCKCIHAYPVYLLLAT